VKESRDASDDRCDSLATALVNYARAKVAGEKRQGYTSTSWTVDVTDNPDNARTLACALLVTVCLIYVYTTRVFYGIICTRKRRNSNIFIMRLCYLIICFQCEEFYFSIFQVYTCNVT
jgi:hypothetical protein